MSKFKFGAILTGVIFVVVLILFFMGSSFISTGSIGIVKHMDGKVTVIPQGYKWTGFGVSVQEYPTYMQAVKSKEWEIGTADQQELSTDTNLTWKISQKEAGALYQSVGGKDIDYVSSNIVQTTMKNVVNKITHKYSWNSIKGADQSKITDEINAELKRELLRSGIELGTFGFSRVGAPQGMQQSQQALASSELNIKKAQQEQEKAKIENQTKIFNAQAEAQAKQIAAEGEAKANQALAKSITPELVEYKKIDKWDGKNPTTILGAGTSTSIIMK